MEQKSSLFWKSSLTYGVYLGIVLILLSVVYYVTGNTFAKSASWVTYAIMIGGVVFAQINYRKVLGGIMSYGEALGIGVLSVLFASIMLSIYTYLLYDIIDPSLQEQLRLLTEEQLYQQRSMPEEQMEMAVEMSTKFQQPWLMAVSGVFVNTFIGLLISLITSIFTKKKPSE